MTDLARHALTHLDREGKGEEFAREILRLLDFLQTEEEKTFALGGCLWSEYVPFRQLPGEPVHMSEEEYAHVLQANKEKKEFIEYISQLPFDQLTERASMVLQVVDDVDEKRLRVGLVALALGQMEMRGIKRVAEIVQRSR